MAPVARFVERPPDPDFLRDGCGCVAGADAAIHRLRADALRRGIDVGIRGAAAIIRTPPNQVAHPVPHMQAFATAAQEAVGITNWGTYEGHDTDINHGLDGFVAPASYNSDPSLANALADFTVEHMDEFGIWYTIRRQEIFNPAVAPYWRPMARRGNPTADHFCHNHHTFLAVAPDAPTPEEEFMANLSDERLARLLSQIDSIDDNTKVLGPHLFALLGAGNWELGAARIVNAVRLIEKLAGQGITNLADSSPDVEVAPLQAATLVLEEVRRREEAALQALQADEEDSSTED